MFNNGKHDLYAAFKQETFWIKTLKINEGVARCKVYPSLWVALYSWHPDNSSYILLYCVYNSLVWVYKLFSALTAYLTEGKNSALLLCTCMVAYMVI